MNIVEELARALGAGGDEAPAGPLGSHIILPPSPPVPNGCLRLLSAAQNSSATCHSDGDKRRQLDRHTGRLGGQASLVQQRAGLARICRHCHQKRAADGPIRLIQLKFQSFNVSATLGGLVPRRLSARRPRRRSRAGLRSLSAGLATLATLSAAMNSSATARNGFQLPMNAIGILAKGNPHAIRNLRLRLCALSPFRLLGSHRRANRDLLRISNLNTEWSVIDARLVEPQRYGL